MAKECEELQTYMYRLGITHPNVNLQFNLNVGGAKSSSSFWQVMLFYLKISNMVTC